ncbi:hypothetical protein TWF730_007324 [Orbilia blumenaviensis]|uniref:RING-type domain-containing protein n=1 Tax=Orbilia blumenaviensis TaxID=1796055 RepID=A0AAV9V833_9PEZI
MWCHLWFATLVISITIFSRLSLAALPEIPEGANFVYQIDGDAIISNKLIPKTISGWNKHPGSRYPEPCFPLADTDTRKIYIFEHIRRLALNAIFYDIPRRDSDIKFEFFQDDECRVPNHPRMLYSSGEYTIPEEIKTRIGSLRLIDPLSLAFLRNPYLSRVNPSEDILLRNEERWSRDKRLFDEVRADLSAGNKDRICTICQLSLVEREPSSALLGDCGHSYHHGCLERWAAANPEGGRRDPVEFRRKTGFPLVQMTSCPDCRKPLNPRKMARIPTQGVDDEEEGDGRPDQLRNEPVIPRTPERQRNNIAERHNSPTIGPPSLYTSPGSDLEDLVNAEYMDERARGPSRVRRPANYDFQSAFVGNNPLVLPEDYTNYVLEAPFSLEGPDVLPRTNPDVNTNPFLSHTDYDHSVNEGLSGFNGIGRSLRSGQLG